MDVIVLQPSTEKRWKIHSIISCLGVVNFTKRFACDKCVLGLERPRHFLSIWIKIQSARKRHCFVSLCSLWNMDAASFVCYERGSQEVVGVKEFQVAVALLEGQKDLLSRPVPSQWGRVHLFDLCATFGHLDTAWAMAEKGVAGCRLEVHHLKRQAVQTGVSHLIIQPCPCIRWQTCEGCCFGFPVEQGIWMKDWDAELEDAIAAARRTAKKALVCAILGAMCSGAPLPFTVSEEAIVHLLDIAILTGNKEAAVCCAKQSKLRPLRRWRWGDVFLGVGRRVWWQKTIEDDRLEFFNFSIRLKSPGLLNAVLSVGAELQSLTNGCLPLREAVALSTTPWADFAKLLPVEGPWLPKQDNYFGCYFIDAVEAADSDDDEIDHLTLSKDRLLEADAAGIPLNRMEISRAFRDDVNLVSLTLLDLAILFGQSDCAALCAATNVKLSEDGSTMLQQSLNADPARRPAAAAAAQKFLALSWKSEISEKGVTVFQLMKKLSCGRSFPKQLVNQVIAFSLDVPEVVQQLDLWGEAHAWCQSAHLMQAFSTLKEM